MIFLTKAQTYWRLGLRSLIDVGLYRIGLKAGQHPVLKISAPDIPNQSFYPDVKSRKNGPEVTDAWADKPWAFGLPVGDPSDNPPDWHANIFTGIALTDIDCRWDKVPTFSEQIGDIKTVWEASRFDWVLAFAQSAANSDTGALTKLNRWLSDWINHNPAYKGPNWICGQEASIRVAHLVLASLILDHEMPLSPALEAFLLTHLRRIKPTIAYARGQNNNHATSEAMALYVGGLYLVNKTENNALRQEAADYITAGRKLAEERVRHLIFEDGGFAQYSFVYHRLMLDSLSIMELFRLKFADKPFHSSFTDKAVKASKWLRFFVDPQTGDVPNMGSNDGAWLLPIGRGLMRDFRPSCALASTLFEKRTAFSPTLSVKDILGWLNIEILEGLTEPNRPSVCLFPDSGIVAMTLDDIRLYMRLPGTRYRPHQADALHVELWKGNANLLSDAGTFSYAEKGWEYFQSTRAHNTVEFDGRDQMPRLSRFLFGKWLKRETVRIDSKAISATASYTDYRGCYHQRSVSIAPDCLIVTDTLKGPFKRAIIRWRVMPTTPQTSNDHIEPSSLNIEITKDEDAQTVQTKRGYHSLYYYRKKENSILTSEVFSSATIVSKIKIS